MLRTSLAVAAIAASLGLPTGAHAFISYNGTSLNGCSEQGTSLIGDAQDGHPTVSAAPGAENAGLHAAPAATQPLTIAASEGTKATPRGGEAESSKGTRHANCPPCDLLPGLYESCCD